MHISTELLLIRLLEFNTIPSVAQKQQNIDCEVVNSL